MFYKTLIRPLLFLMEAEQAHHFIFRCIRIILKLPLMKTIFRLLYCPARQPSFKLHGIEFGGRIGLAAGFDKNALLADEWEFFGFSFIEIGTVTPRPQPGNPKPRIFRLVKDEAIINRMGFNNDGADVIAERLRKRKGKIIIGGNIGKNKDTPNSHAAEDYLYCFRKLFEVVDFFTVNVSSPNTPGLRDLQEGEQLRSILTALQEENRKRQAPKPVFLKISPDLNKEQLDEIISVVEETNLAGIIATNTTVSREGLKSSASLVQQAGGLSGKPLRKKSDEMLAYVAAHRKKKFILIASGGIHSESDALNKINSGADLVQLYTGFIYEGPGLVKRIAKAMAAMKSESN
jgi:dihydroorotate dehydrogenase